MEAMDKRKKDRLVKGVALNTLVFVGCITYIFLFVMPKYDDIDTTVGKINASLSDTSKLQKDGVDKDAFRELLTRLGKKKEVPDTVFSDPGKLSKVLLKPATVKKDYLAWLIEENGKISALDEEIRKNDAILGNIIPVFANSSTLNASNDMDNQLTLASLVSHVEKDMLGKYGLTSYSPIGISNISFPDKKDTPVNIGSFKISLDFKGKNSDILALVDAIQKSGKLTVRNGKLASDTPLASDPAKTKGLSDLSNLLINIDSFSLDSIPTSPSDSNKGSMTLEFYVEGMNYQKVLALRSILTTKFEWLKKSIKEKGLLCTKPWNPLCNETATANAVANIKSLTKNLDVLQEKIDTFKKGSVAIDIPKEVDTLSEIKASLDTIEKIYLKNNAVLEKTKK